MTDAMFADDGPSPLLDPTPVLVLGLGNVLCTDDGAGVRAVHGLLRHHLPRDDVRILDGGTLGLALLPVLEQADTVVIVDAVRVDGMAPGTIVRLEGEDVAPAVAERLSVHQIGVVDLLDGARLQGTFPGKLVLVGVVPESLGLGLGCTQAVDEAIPALVDAVAQELSGLGFPLERRTRIDDTDADRIVPSARAFGM